MNRALVGYACLMTCVALWLALRGDAGAQDAPPTTTLNGDVDCDGRVNLTDAVLILRWVFSDGPAPCELEVPEPEVVTATPQIARPRSACADLCDAPCVDTKEIPDEVPPLVRGDGVFVDPELKIEWKTATEIGSFSWCEAQAVAHAAGDGWRIPTLFQALSLQDPVNGRLREPFDPALRFDIWTSTWSGPLCDNFPFCGGQGGGPIGVRLGGDAISIGSFFGSRVLLVREMQR